MEKNIPPSFPAKFTDDSSSSKGHSRSLSNERSAIRGAISARSGDLRTITPAFSEYELAMPAPHQVEETLQTFKWIEAIRSSDLNALSLLLKTYHGTEFTFGTPLHLAAAFAQKAVVEHVLKALLEVKSFNISSADKNGNTPLHIAAKAGRLSICELLLKHGADCTISNNDGRDASEVAKTQSVIDLIIAHRKQYAAAKSKDILALANSGNMTAVQNLFNDTRIAKLVNINHQDPMSGDTLLHISAEQNNFDMVTWCLKMRADPLLRDKKGKLALERTKNDRIKQILKGALTQPTFSNQHSPGSGGVKMQGVLYKWTNYAGGYKRRWFVLEDGVLSYYRSQEDVPVSCRGSISLQVAKLWIDGSDRNRFDILGRGNIRYHLRADQPMEAKRWVIALTEAKQWLQDHDEFRNRVEKTQQAIAASNSGGSDMTNHDSDVDRDAVSDHSNEFNDEGNVYEENFHATINAALAAVHSQKQLMQTVLTVLETNPTNTQIAETFKKSSQSLLVTLNELLRLNNDRERYWERRVEREEALKKMWEENLRSLAAEHDSLQIKAAEEVKNLQDKARTMSTNDVSDGEEEFYDVESESTMAPMKNSNALISTSLNGYPPHPPDDLRKTLPLSNIERVELSLWSVLKNNIGKDLSKIALPVFFNEPLSMLQRLCEDMEYSSLLDVAASKDNPLERLQFVAAFAMSNYSSTEGRAGKPFNPLLGETFEYVRKDRGFRYIAEQVSHHPPICACYCESESYVFWAEANLKNKFWGKSLEIFPQGTCHVILKKTNEHFSWRKVTTCVNNLIVGKLWIDHYGDMIVTNHTSGDVCTLTFKPAGWRGKSQYEIDGNVKDTEGKIRYEISGHWNDKLVTSVTGDNSEHSLLWKRIPIPDNASTNYNFTEFAMSLNELYAGMEKWLCKTDSRLRPDQKAMEMGDYDLADREKIRVEESQRLRRRAREESSDDWKPMWFKREVESDTGEEHWRYKGGYWESRDKQWSDAKVIPIFE